MVETLARPCFEGLDSALSEVLPLEGSITTMERNGPWAEPLHMV